jgi:peptidoglycan/xylan/chitin deacetylase (PgdA/CDA1 family)
MKLPLHQLKRILKRLRLIKRLSHSIPRRLFLERISPPTLILMYHRVCDLKDDRHFLTVHPDNFQKQMEFLKTKFDLVPLAAWTQPGNRQRVKVAITFDDGYADNFYQALPILEKYEIPFCVFVCTGPVEQQCELPTDRFDRIIDAAIQEQPGDKIYPHWFFGDRARLPRARMALHQQFYRLNPRQREKILLPAEAALQISSQAREAFRPMTIAEVETLSRHPLATIGAHTENHPCLSHLSPYGQQEEISLSKFKLERWVGKTITSFAYPYGRAGDYNKNSVKACHDLGFQRAVTTEPSQAWSDTPVYRLPRLPGRNWSIEQFRHVLSLYRWF